MKRTVGRALVPAELVVLTVHKRSLEDVVAVGQDESSLASR